MPWQNRFSHDLFGCTSKKLPLKDRRGAHTDLLSRGYVSGVQGKQKVDFIGTFFLEF